MLIFSRKRNQRIRIGDDIEVEITEIRGDRVRIGITAPSDLNVHREEMYIELGGHHASRPVGVKVGAGPVHTSRKGEAA